MGWPQISGVVGPHSTSELEKPYHYYYYHRQIDRLLLSYKDYRILQQVQQLIVRYFTLQVC